MNYNRHELGHLRSIVLKWWGTRQLSKYIFAGSEGQPGIRTHTHQSILVAAILVAVAVALSPSPSRAAVLVAVAVALSSLPRRCRRLRRRRHDRRLHRAGAG